jgi:hypothetical protein
MAKQNSLAVNTFEGGMNQDFSKTVNKKSMYYYAKNFRPFTDKKGQGLGGTLNVIGNNLDFNIPDTKEVWSFDTRFIEPFPSTVTLTMTLSLTPFVDVFNISGTTPSELRDSLVAEINNTLHYYENGIYAAAVETEGVILYSVGFPIASPATWSSTDPSIFNLGVSIGEQSNLKVIGWTTIRDTFVLFTTNNVEEIYPSYGQVWTLKYDPVFETPALQLVYNNALNFSTFNPIEAVGRYETEKIQKVYWTDNYNKVRSLNVETTASLGLLPPELDLSSNVDMELPVLTSLSGGGVLKTGVYQYAYRLRTLSGSESSFSRVSRHMHIHKDSEAGTKFWEYIGTPPGVTTGNALTYVINGVDTRFDFIEVVAIYKTGIAVTPIITSILIDAIPSDGVFSFTHTGTEESAFDITTDEFLLAKNVFSRAKTLTVKDNRLFVGNVSTTPLELNFDTRAYGHALNSDEFSIDGVVENDFSTIQEEANCINDDFYIYKHRKNSNTYGGTGTNISYEIKTSAYRADVRTLGTSSLGFDKTPFYNAIDPPAINPVDLGEGRTYPQFTAMADSYKNNITFGLKKGYQRDETYRMGIVFFDKEGSPSFAKWIADVKIPPVFDPGRSSYGTDNYNNASFQGKIMVEPPTTLPQSPLQSINIVYIAFTVNLPTEVLSQISGYSIVRMERPLKDRSVVGQGVALPIGVKFTVDEAGGSNPSIRTPLALLEDDKTYLFQGPNYPNRFNYTRDYATNANPLQPTVQDSLSSIEYPKNYFTLISPDYALTDEIDFSSGDYIKTVDTITSGNSTLSSRFAPDIAYSSKGFIYVSKYYDSKLSSRKDYIGNTTVNVEDIYKLKEKSIVEIDNDIIFHNEPCAPFLQSGDATPEFWGLGGKSLLLKVNSPIHAPVPVSTSIYTGPAVYNTGTDYNNVITSGWENLLLVNYKRNVLKQYNGNTYANRSSNEYISTGHYVSVVKKEVSSLTDTTSVYGGDTFIALYDQQIVRKDWAWTDEFGSQALYNSSGVAFGVEGKLSKTVVFAVESTINTAMRSGRFVGANGLTDTNSNSDTPSNNDTLTGSCDIGESYGYYSVYSVEDNVVTFFNKPLEFIPNQEFDTRIYNSDPKVNGEASDSWSYFRPLDFIDLESKYGPINKILTHNDNFFSFQNDGVAVVSVSPRVAIQSSDDINIEIGTGEVLQSYNYVSNTVGCKHQWSIVSSQNYIYWVDVLNKKAYRMSGAQGVQPLSDLKGMNSFFKNNLEGLVTLDEKNKGDNPLRKQGITSYYDEVNSEIVFVVLGAKRTHIIQHDVTYIDPPEWSAGDWLIVIGPQLGPGIPPKLSYYLITENFYYIDPESIPPNTSDQTLQSWEDANYYALGYHELGEYFTSFYDSVNTIFPHKNDVLLSPGLEGQSQVMYRYNRGDRGEFFGVIKPSTIKFVVNPIPLASKVFGNMEWSTEVNTISGADVPEETFDTVLCETDYQATVLTPLIVNTNVKRKERAWRFAVPRNNNESDRLRDKSMTVTFTYNNTNNNRMLLNANTTAFTHSSR